MLDCKERSFTQVMSRNRALVGEHHRLVLDKEELKLCPPLWALFGRQEHVVFHVLVSLCLRGSKRFDL